MNLERLNTITTPLSFKGITLAILVIAVASFATQKSYSKSNGSMDSGLIEEHDFQSLVKLMQQKKLPLLLELHADYCPYCRELEEDFLAPMVASSEYDDKIIIRQLPVELDDEIVDFQGKKITAGQFARRYNAFMTPTMIFLDGNGVEVAEKIVGFNTPSLFGAYIDIEIEKALTKVRAKSSLAKREVLQEGLNK